MVVQVLANESDGTGLQLITDTEAAEMLSQRRSIFGGIGRIKASQITTAAVREKYLEPAGEIGNQTMLRVTHLEGLRFIDGVPFLRVGLWKAWYKEHGWMLTVIPASVIGAVVIWGVQNTL